MPRSALLLAFSILAAIAAPASGQGHERPRLSLTDVFELEYAADPQISPDGQRIAYLRRSMDAMKDRVRSQLWLVDRSGARRPIGSSSGSDASPRWSPSGDRLAYIAGGEHGPQIFVRWLASGETAQLTRVQEGPSSLAWSPDGQRIAFTMFVPEPARRFVNLPASPKGAEWAAPPIEVSKLHYRADGGGYLRDGHRHIFAVSAEGGTPRQLTCGPHDHGGSLSWTPDGARILFSANLNDESDFQPRESEVYQLELKTGAVKALTDRRGPDSSPVVSPDGSRIAYLGFDDRRQGYQVTRLSVMKSDGSEAKVLTASLDRDASSPVWSADSQSIVFKYDDRGRTRIATADLEGEVKTLSVRDLGGTSLGRPYPGGSFSVSADGDIAYTRTSTQRPADLALYQAKSGKVKRLTDLNGDLLGARQLARVEELWCESSFDKRRIQSWVLRPPNFDPKKKYPLILEIHGGPFANYGPRFAAELQLYAAAGYVVVYSNPRGSTSYGGEFGNLIHHKYPDRDYDDLMSAVDAVIAKGSIDTEHLFVTGGSGGGVLSAWIIGKTDRFRAAVVCKPVINWFSFALTADAYPFFTQYWFPGMPWEKPSNYYHRSPISLVGNVKTPAMVLTGEQDFRTPMSESEQYYQALKLRKIDTMLVRIPGASHSIARRPSQLMAKAAYVLKWFEVHSKLRAKLH